MSCELRAASSDVLYKRCLGRQQARENVNVCCQGRPSLYSRQNLTHDIIILPLCCVSISTQPSYSLVPGIQSTNRREPVSRLILCGVCSELCCYTCCCELRYCELRVRIRRVLRRVARGCIGRVARYEARILLWPPSRLVCFTRRPLDTATNDCCFGPPSWGEDTVPLAYTIIYMNSGEKHSTAVLPHPPDNFELYFIAATQQE